MPLPVKFEKITFDTDQQTVITTVQDLSRLVLAWKDDHLRDTYNQDWVALESWANDHGQAALISQIKVLLNKPVNKSMLDVQMRLFMTPHRQQHMLNKGWFYKPFNELVDAVNTLLTAYHQDLALLSSPSRSAASPLPSPTATLTPIPTPYSPPPLHTPSPPSTVPTSSSSQSPASPTHSATPVVPEAFKPIRTGPKYATEAKAAITRMVRLITALQGAAELAPEWQAVSTYTKIHLPSYDARINSKLREKIENTVAQLSDVIGLDDAGLQAVLDKDLGPYYKKFNELVREVNPLLQAYSHATTTSTSNSRPTPPSSQPAPPTPPSTTYSQGRSHSQQSMYPPYIRQPASYQPPAPVTPPTTSYQPTTTMPPQPVASKGSLSRNPRLAQQPEDQKDPHKQAARIYRELRQQLHDNLHLHIGLLYSANRGQADSFVSAYGTATPVVTGSGQAELFGHLAKLMNQEMDSTIRARIRILPISTLDYGKSGAGVEAATLQRDLNNVQSHINGGWHVYGIPRGQTAEFAIGGGVAGPGSVFMSTLFTPDNVGLPSDASGAMTQHTYVASRLAAMAAANPIPTSLSMPSSSSLSSPCRQPNTSLTGTPNSHPTPPSQSQQQQEPRRSPSTPPSAQPAFHPQSSPAYESVLSATTTPPISAATVITNIQTIIAAVRTKYQGTDDETLGSTKVNAYNALITAIQTHPAQPISTTIAAWEQTRVIGAQTNLDIIKASGSFFGVGFFGGGSGKNALEMYHELKQQIIHAEKPVTSTSSSSRLPPPSDFQR